MPVGSSWRDLSTRPKRYNSESVLNESWRQFYDIDGDSVGRGGAGKVFRVKPKSPKNLHERKASVPANLSEGQFRPLLELINEIPDEKPLAVKIIRRFRSGRDSIDKIRNEINLIKKLRPSTKDASIPRAVAPLLYSVHEDPTQVAIVMEFAHGGSLFDLCSPKTSNRSPLPPGEGRLSNFSASSSKSLIPETYISSVLLRVTDALAFMHEKANIVHLDIKAENILLREPYPSSDVFITDFGLASVLSSTKPHKELAGTPDYTAVYKTGNLINDLEYLPTHSLYL
ncbi:hypothetical protein Aperf_G00000064285 [Anoplocephala perfoliata]